MRIVGHHGAMTNPRRMRAPDEFWANAGLLLIAAVAGMFLIQLATVGVLSWLTATPFPNLTIWQTLSLWAKADPTAITGQRSGAVAHWVIVAGITGCLSVPFLLWWRKHTRNERSEAMKRALATRNQLAKHAGAKQLVARGRTLRPSLENKKPIHAEDVGYGLGKANGIPIWMSVEDSMILVGPSRSGKGFNFIVPMLTKAMGAVVTTSTRADNLELTLEQRKRTGGPVWVFDPAGVATGAGSTLRWSPLEGAENVDVATRRLASLIPKGGFEGVQNASYWEATSKKIVLALFHAAALDRRTIHDFWAWISDPNLAKTQALEILNTHPLADRLVARSLDAVLSGSVEQRGNDWAAAYADVAFLASPKVREALAPSATERFDPFDFIMNKGTLYMVGDAVAASAFEPVIVALLEEVAFVAQGIAGASVGKRLDPPVQFILDEAANFKIPTLPKMISYAGGSGLTVIVVLQSISQAEVAWGREGAKAMWGASSLKMVLPGGSDPADLKDLETLIGEVEIERYSYSTGKDAGVSHQYAREEKRALRASEIRTLPAGTGLVFFRQLKPALVKLTPWTELPIATQLRRDKIEVAKRMMEASPYAQRLKEHNAQRG